MTSHTTRFAPSPTGYLHLGHVVSAMHARAHAGVSGRFLIRIEDIDAQRCTPELSTAVLDDLAWLGFVSEGPIIKQSDHLPRYRALLDELRAKELIYSCGCTRAEIAAHSTQRAPDGSLVYPGTCRHRPVPADRVPVWRLDMARALDAIGGEPGWHEEVRGRIVGDAAAFGDVVLGRRDNGVSYHLCVTQDDAMQGIDLVTRGMDLFETTAVHRVLQELLGYPEPAYAHHALLFGADGKKLSKRDGAEAVRNLRERGTMPEQVLALARTVLTQAGMCADR